MTQYRHRRAEIDRPLWRSSNRVILNAKNRQQRISEKADRLQRTFTIWVKHTQQAQIRVVARDVTNVHAAIRQALEKAAEEWACDPDTLNIHGIAEGDITDLDAESILD
jgi:hypothetical protein